MSHKKTGVMIQILPAIEEKKKTYICPHCGHEQDTIIQWQTVSEAWEINLKTKESNQVDSEGGDLESWNCPECGGRLSDKLVSQLSPF